MNCVQSSSCPWLRQANKKKNAWNALVYFLHLAKTNILSIIKNFLYVFYITHDSVYFLMPYLYTLLDACVASFAWKSTLKCNKIWAKKENWLSVVRRYSNAHSWFNFVLQKSALPQATLEHCMKHFAQSQEFELIHYGFGESATWGSSSASRQGINIRTAKVIV